MDREITIYDLNDEEMVKFSKLKALSDNHLVAHYGSKIEDLMNDSQHAWSEYRKAKSQREEMEERLNEAEAFTKKHDMNGIKYAIGYLLKAVGFKLICSQCKCYDNKLEVVFNGEIKEVEDAKEN